mgnify:CR=1 FL=1
MVAAHHIWQLESDIENLRYLMNQLQNQITSNISMIRSYQETITLKGVELKQLKNASASAEEDE